MVKESDAIKYLIAYGYLPPKATGSVSKTAKSVTAAVTKFQDAYGNALPTTGELDAKTLKAMESPRCGVADFIKRSGPAKWPERDWKSNPIKYGFERVLSGIAQKAQLELFAEAVAEWNRVIGLPLARAAKKSERVDVVISTGRGKRDSFDGPGRTLAWAYVAGELLRFDEEELWLAAPSDRGIPYKNVASHEWGHILGLDHSLKKGALMEPFMNPAVASPVSPDDIEEGQLRYPGGGEASGPIAKSLILTFDTTLYTPRIEGANVIFESVQSQPLKKRRRSK